MMYKLRTISTINKNYPSAGPVKALTVPNEIALFFSNTSFSVQKSGCCIVYTSGPVHTITKKQVSNYKYEDCRVK